MRVLCVAEKPSIARSVAQILSGGQFTTHNTTNKYIKNYAFDYPQTNSSFTVTAVSGHLMTHDFSGAFRQWKSCDPFDLFEAEIESTVAPDAKSIEKNLIDQAKRAQTLMIWTDCDREGENIGAEVSSICRKANRNIVVRRARFSAIIPQQIHHAAQHPVELDMGQVHAVEARKVLDLRLGAAFTRMQTLNLQQRFGQRLSDVISYGPCQFPTLGFVVSRYNQVKSFVPEPFWYIFLSVLRQTTDKREEVVFTSRRGHMFDLQAAANIYEGVVSEPLARVTKVTNKDTKKWKPLPLTTVELQKSGSRLLKLAPKKLLDVGDSSYATWDLAYNVVSQIAEKLYQQGFLSYPRTETDQFDPQFDFMSLIQKQTVDSTWGNFATSLQQGEFNKPRNGKKNDHAHPPIHPTAHVANLTGDEKRVYEFITRRFLACCSMDALGAQTTVDVLCGGEEFYVTGLIVLERNYLKVYPYDKWSSNELPEFREGEEFMPSVCEVREGETTRPALLTEADLVNLMDKNGIGTDATIAQHIQTIVDRGYIIERMEGSTKYLVPSTLGIGLVEGYNKIDFERSLSKPQLRRETEWNMVQVCEGLKTKNDMLEQAINQYKEIYIKARSDFGKVINSVQMRVDGGNGEGGGGDGGGGDGGGGGGGGGGGSEHRGGNSNDDGNGNGESSRGSGRDRGAISGGTRGGRTRGRSRSNVNYHDPSEDGDNNPPPPTSRSRSNRTEPTMAQSSRAQRPQAHPPTPSSSGQSSAPSCECNTPAQELVVIKETSNKGRKFWGCADRTCNFFQWSDGPSTEIRKVIPAKRTASEHLGQGSSTTGARMCWCELESNVVTVKKEGENLGRKFWCCSKQRDGQCGFFEWDDEPPRANQRTNPRDGPSEPKRTQSYGTKNSNTSSTACFRCGEEGHWSNACPKPGGNPSYSSKPKSSRPEGPKRTTKPRSTSSTTRGRSKKGGATKSKFSAADE